MADAPWRCSQCGTVNEPSATSCRTCGRWPSLFDLEDGAVGTDEQSGPGVEEDVLPGPRYAEEPTSAAEPRAAEPEPLPDDVRSESATPTTPSGSETSGEPWRGPEPPIPSVPPGTWVRRSRLVVPLLILVYVLVSLVLRNH